MPERSVILLAEDREDDILLIRRAFSKAYIYNPLQVVRDGEEVVFARLDYGRYTDGIRFANKKEISLQLLGPGVRVTLAQAEQKQEAGHRSNPGPDGSHARE